MWNEFDLGEIISTYLKLNSTYIELNSTYLEIIKDTNVDANNLIYVKMEFHRDETRHDIRKSASLGYALLRFVTRFISDVSCSHNMKKITFNSLILSLMDPHLFSKLVL